MPSSRSSCLHALQAALCWWRLRLPHGKIAMLDVLTSSNWRPFALQVREIKLFGHTIDLTKLHNQEV